MMNLRINKEKIVLFLSVVAMLGMWTFVVNGNSRGNAAIKEKEVLGKAQIVVYKKGEKILIDPDAPHFKELQLACEEMLVPVEPHSATLDSFLKFLHPSEMHLPDADELRKKEFSINIVYEEKATTSMTGGFGPAAAPTVQINLSEFIVPLSGDLTQIKIQWDRKEYPGNYLYLVSDFYQKQFVTTRDVKKIKTVLSRYAIIP